MKLVYTFLIFAVAITAFAVRSHAQCSILISYDDNGYRIKRAKAGCRPSPPADSSSNVTDQTIQHTDSVTTYIPSTFQIYPNPSTARVIVQLDAVSLQSKCTLTVTDAIGKTLKQQTLTAAITEIDLSCLADCLYFFVVQRGEKINTVRVVKEQGAGNH
jgi:hypothetical protein